MRVHSLSIDSSQRVDLDTHPNDYVVHLENAIYDVSEMKLVSARIPTPQLTVCATNNTFSVSGQTVSLTNADYHTGDALATALENQLAPPASMIDQVTFDADTKRLTFSNTLTQDFTLAFTSEAPHQVLGFTSNLYTSSGGILTSGAIGLHGPHSLVLRLSVGSDEFTQSVYTSVPFYTGHVLLDGSDVVNFYGNDDHLIHAFHSGPKKSIRELRITFFYMSHGKLIPYDFMNQDHVLKFDITCSTDKLENLKTDHPVEEPVKSPEAEKTIYTWWKKEYAYIVGIILVGIFLMMCMKPRTLSV